MNINHLEYFQCLAELQHYAQAAAKLHTSQSNLSYAILTLEDEIGVKLFEKRGRNVKLTKNGATFLNYANRILNELASGKQAVREDRSAQDSVVRVSAYHIRSLSWLLQDFQNQNGNESIRIELNHHKTKDTIQYLKSQKIDIGFCSYPVNDESLAFFPSLTQEIVVLLPIGHPLAQQDHIDLTEIAYEPVIIPHGGDGMYKRIVGLFEQIGIYPKFACEADSTNATVYLVSTGCGIGLVVDNPTFHNSNISVIPLQNPPHKFYTYLVTRKGPLSLAATKLKEYILEKQMAL